jgi:spore coat protein CotH
MAAQTLLLNQDRCTKNFYAYQDPGSGQWSMFPW